MPKLTAARIRSLKTPSLHGDGAGLYLKISRTGARSWIQRVVVAGKRRDIGLGRFPDVGLAQAREAVAHNRRLIAAGGDPLAKKRKVATPTFREAAERTFEANKPRWRNGKRTVGWWQSLERHAFPVIGDMPVDRIGREDMLRILTPIGMYAWKARGACGSASARSSSGPWLTGMSRITSPARPSTVLCRPCRESKTIFERCPTKRCIR